MLLLKNCTTRALENYNMLRALGRLRKSFVYASRGLLKVVREEQNFRVELIVAIGVVVLAYELEVTYQDWAILLLAIALVLCLEIVNTVAELISDAVQPKLSHYAKNIKDVVAGGVLVASIAAGIVGIVVFSHYL